MYLMNRRLLLAAGLALMLTLAGTRFNLSAQASSGGRLRFVHAVPGAPAVDIAVDKAVAARGLEYANATRFLNVTAGDHTITITASGGKTQIFQGKVSVAAGQAETVIAEGTAKAVEAGVYEDDLGPLAPGNTRLTASHAIKDAPAVDVVRGDGSPLIQGLKYGVPYGAFDIPATSVSISVVPAGSDVKSAVITIDNVLLDAGTHNRLVALGTVQGSVKPSYLLLSAGTDADNPSGAELVRFVHASPDAPAVDLYVGDKLYAPGLTFGSFTPHIAIAAGSVDVTVRSAGSSATSDALAKGSLTLTGGKATTVVIGGSANGLTITNSDDNIATLAPNKVRIHVINATSDGTATLKLGAATVLASAAKPDATGTEVAPGIYDLAVSVDNPTLQLTDKQPLSGGVLYDLVVAGNDKSSKLIVAATGLNEQPGSAPSAPIPVAVAQAPTTAVATEAAQPTAQATSQPTATSAPATEAAQPTVQPPSPTTEPAQPEPPTQAPNPPTEVAQEPTATLVPPTKPPAPANPQGIIATVQTNEGVNLKIREYPRTDARTLALVPSGTDLVVTGVQGPVPPTGQPTATGTPGPTPTINA